MAAIGNLICLTPRDSYVADTTPRNGPLGRLERSIGPFVRSPGIAFPYIVGFLRQNGVLTDSTRVAVQHDKIEGPVPFEEILEEKLDLRRGDHDVLFVTAYTDSAREAYRRAREAKAAYARAGRKLTVVMGGPHASALPDEGVSRGHIDATIPGEGEWAAAALLTDIKENKPLQSVYRTPFARIRDRGALSLDMDIWRGLRRPPQQIVASSHFARGCKLDCHFCAVFLTNGPTVRNRDVADVVDEIRAQSPVLTRETISRIGPGFYNKLLRALVSVPIAGSLYGDRLIAAMGPGFTHRYFFWDDNLYNASGSFKALCEAIRPLNRPWAAELTIDIAEKPELLSLAYESGCRELFLGIESVDQAAVDGLGKWSNNIKAMRERVQRIHDAGIKIMGSFVFGLDGDDPSIFERTLAFIYETRIDYIVANIIQPYPGTGTFRDAVAGKAFLPSAQCPPDSDVAMDYNWPRFDGAHVLMRPQGMTVDQLQEGYYHFLREAYSITGIMRRFQGGALNVPAAASHLARNYLLSRYGMSKTRHAIGRKPGEREPLPAHPDEGAAIARPHSGVPPRLVPATLSSRMTESSDGEG